MKKMIFAVVMMFALTLNAGAQSVTPQRNDPKMSEMLTSRQSLDRIAQELGITIEQWTPFTNAMQQMGVSMDYFASLTTPAEQQKAWEAICKRHMTQMEQLLTPSQFEHYRSLFQLTVDNRAREIISQMEQAKK